MNVLFIGNSYTYYNDLPALFETLCRANRQEVRVFSVTCGGRKLYENLDEFGMDLRTDDDYAARIGELAEDYEFDVLFLQEQSCLPILDPTAFRMGVMGLSSVIGAWRTVLYATWGREAGSDTLTAHGWTHESMTADLQEAYADVAADCGFEISPVGLCFDAVKTAVPGAELYDPDKTHPSYMGSCVAALSHYKVVFGEMPAVLSFPELDDDTARALAAAVDETVVLDEE